MSYVWTYPITTGGYVYAGAALEIKGNISAELGARSTSYTFTQMASCTSGSYIYAAQVNELRAAADVAHGITGCTINNASHDSTVDASADATVDSTAYGTVDSGDDSSVDGTANSGYDSSEDGTDNGTDNGTINFGYLGGD